MSDDYLVKSMMRAYGIHPGEGQTEEQANYTHGLVLMEMLMEGKPTQFTRDGECLGPEAAARTAADAWDADFDRLLAKALEWAPLMELRREDPEAWRAEMAKRMVGPAD